FVGFTGGTGGETAWQAVESWTANFVNAPPPPHLEVTNFPTTAAAVPQDFSVTQQTAFFQTVQHYAATVHFTTNDPTALLPDDYTFVAADKGSHQFAAVLFHVGTDTITATDNSTPTPLTDTLSILVTPAATSGFVVSDYPSPTTAGDAHTFTVTAVDR